MEKAKQQCWYTGNKIFHEFHLLVEFMRNMLQELLLRVGAPGITQQTIFLKNFSCSYDSHAHYWGISMAG